MDISSIFSTPSTLDNSLVISDSVSPFLDNSLVISDSIATVLDNSFNLVHPIAPTLDNSLVNSDSMVLCSEAEFLKQAELTCSSLQQFIAVQYFENADEIKRGVLNKLIKNTVRCLFLHFLSFFLY